MSNYNQYYYKGDTINARIADDGVALDLRNDETRSKMYDSNYRLGLAKQLNSLYRRVNGYDSGISDESMSLEILAHAMGYDFATGLNGDIDRGALILNPTLFALLDNKNALEKRKDIYNSAKEANIGKNDIERKYLDFFGNFAH